MSRSIRFAFLAFAAVLLLLAGMQSLAGPAPRMGLSACGTDANPCRLEALVVTGEPTPEVTVARTVSHVRTQQPVAPRARS